MAICCGKIDKTMQSSKIKSLGYFILFMGYFGMVSIAIAFWSLMKTNIKTTRRILFSLWTLFLLESIRLTIISPQKKAKISGKLFKISPAFSGWFFRYFDTIFIIPVLLISAIIIYGIIFLR